MTFVRVSVLQIMRADAEGLSAATTRALGDGLALGGVAVGEVSVGEAAALVADELVVADAVPVGVLGAPWGDALAEQPVSKASPARADVRLRARVIGSIRQSCVACAQVLLA